MIKDKSVDEKVVQHFAERSDYYAKMKRFDVNPYDETIVDYVCNHCSESPKILEIGGGSGYLLDLIYNIIHCKNLYNLEFSFGIYEKQASDAIRLIGGDGRRLPFKDDIFEFVIIKNVLHHLVGRSRKESKRFAKICIDEIVRVVKNDGYVVILEQYNSYKIFSSILFYLSYVFSIFGIQVSSFGLHKYVIVSFLTPEEVTNLLTSRRTDVEITLKQERRKEVSLKLKLTLLISNIGHILCVGKVHKSEEK
jgi:SAM-dependent methyltransferase